MPPHTARIVSACQSCRRRKIKCGRERPVCAQCLAIKAACEYEATPRVTYRFANDPPSDAQAPHSIPVSQERIAAIEARLDQLHLLIDELKRGQHIEHPGDHLQAPHSIEEVPSSRSLTSQAGTLSRQGQARVHYVSPIYWAALCRESADLDEVISSMTLTRDGTDENVQHDDNLAAHLRQNLPSKDICDQLVDAYFYNCHPLTPLTHVPTFRRSYEGFWSDDREAGPAFQALMLAIFYAGAASMSDADTIASRCRDRALQMVRLAGFPRKPTLDAWRAYILCHGMPLKEEEPLTSVAFVGLALRAANILGLHLDPSRFDLDAIEAEERRRSWLHLVHVDVAIAIAAGLPPLVGISDVQALTETRDELIGTGESLTSTAGILSAAKHKFTLAQRRFLQRLSGGITSDSLQELQERWIELGHYLTEAKERIVDGRNSYDDNPTLNQWAREVIQVFLDQRYYLLCYPLLHDRSYSISETLYRQTVTSCLSFLIRCAELSSNPDYRRFTWSWPGNHQPIHALTIVLNDLQHTPSPIARRVVDVIFALSGRQGGLTGDTPRALSQSGVELWSFIWRLRARTWRMHDWDPESRWDRERAVQCLKEELLPTLASLPTGDDERVIEQIQRVDEQTQAMHVSELSYPSFIDWADMDIGMIAEPFDLAQDE